MKILDAFHTGLNFVLRWFCVILFAGMVALVLAQVLTRFFGVSAPWTEVASRLAFIWQGVIGAAYVIGEKEDVAIDWLVRKMPIGAVRAVAATAHLVMAAFAIWVMIWGGWRNVASGWDDTVQLIPFTQGQTLLVIPLAGALILIYSILHIIDTFRTPAEEILASVDDEDVNIDDISEEGI